MLQVRQSGFEEDFLNKGLSSGSDAPERREARATVLKDGYMEA